ncbi:hypothetical protein J8M21_25820 [Pseudoalteromonas luteoviolacea]|uniref:hypothetical protein n=1 Tax=Pseudoalteromonas luteoviolacea TaxID=43657 RepID=UPI001B39DEAF|nr:hypothetical protein [Pseudoalteromonas luteoviolacea]MBQ4880621.1 hypothetical protein [Pseudoalteromonas luteoviolacea]MBQ4909664.1 hypothetical protein [Pseudoalteromonas luteoviolacea]
MKKKIITQLIKNTDMFVENFKKGKTWMLALDSATKNVRGGVGFSEYSSGTKFFYWVFLDISFPFIFPYSVQIDVDISEAESALYLDKSSSPSDQELTNFLVGKCEMVRDKLRLDYLNIADLLSADYDRLSSFAKADYLLLKFYIERDFNVILEAEPLVQRLNPHNPKTVKFIEFIQFLKSRNELKILEEIESFRKENEKVWKSHFEN